MICVIETKNGQVFEGELLREEDAVIVLFDHEYGRQEIRCDQIDNITRFEGDMSYYDSPSDLRRMKKRENNEKPSH